MQLRWNGGERAAWSWPAAMRSLTLATELNSRNAQHARSDALREMLGLAEPVKRVECFDISHTLGEATVASCVVFDAAGPVRAQYRVSTSAASSRDDMRPCARPSIAVSAAPWRSRACCRTSCSSTVAPASWRRPRPHWPTWAEGVLLVGVAGVERRAGHEALVMPDGRELRPGAANPALQFIQQVRDEAHRFAITGHRGRRQKARMTSKLEDIPGISRRRASLLKHFGGLVGLKAAGEAEIAGGRHHDALAARIYANLHGLATPDAAE